MTREGGWRNDDDDDDEMISFRRVDVLREGRDSSRVSEREMETEREMSF